MTFVHLFAYHTMIYRVSQKLAPLRLLYVFLLAAILCGRKFIKLFAIHILTSHMHQFLST